jgi:hypothetical protein
MRDDAILRDVDQTAGQVTRVRRLQRRVGQTLAGAVRRVEVLENGQAFLEVRDDRRLDDFTRRLGHQAAHAGELTHLRRRTAPEWTSCRWSSSASGGRLGRIRPP